MSDASSSLSFDFEPPREGGGTKEWAEVTENVCRGCSHDCLYCYSASDSAVRFKTRPRDEWDREELTKKALRTTYPKRAGVVMMPSTHDITPFTLPAVTEQARLILASGNKLLLVSKPHLACIRPLLNDLDEWKPQIMFRFTIGSMSPDVCSFWEPGAPSPAERVACLALAFGAGYRTSVSIEPILEGIDNAIRVVEATRGLVTDSIWIGKMNNVGRRLPPGHDGAAARINHLQRDEEIMRLYGLLIDERAVRWKESIRRVLIAHGGQT